MQSSEGNNAEISGLTAAAHELKSPLVLIRQLAFELEKSDDAETQKLARRIRLSSESSLELAGSLTIAENLHQLSFDFAPTNSQQVCAEVIKTLQPLFAEKNRKVYLRYRRKTPLVVANNLLFGRVIAQFMTNALDYSSEQASVEITTKLMKNNVVRTSVRDYGPMVSAGLLNSLHARKKQIERRPSSSRLGLYISEQFAEYMHGSIGVIRHKNGASFYIDVPVSRQLSLL